MFRKSTMSNDSGEASSRDHQFFSTDEVYYRVHSHVGAINKKSYTAIRGWSGQNLGIISPRSWTYWWMHQNVNGLDSAYIWLLEGRSFLSLTHTSLAHSQLQKFSICHWLIICEKLSINSIHVSMLDSPHETGKNIRWNTKMYLIWHERPGVIAILLLSRSLFLILCNNINFFMLAFWTPIIVSLHLSVLVIQWTGEIPEDWFRFSWVIWASKFANCAK